MATLYRSLTEHRTGFEMGVIASSFNQDRPRWITGNLKLPANPPGNKYYIIAKNSIKKGGGELLNFH